MKTRIFYTKFWKDNYIIRLNHKEKLLFNYLLTNQQVNLCGIYELTDREIMFDLNLKPKEFEEMKNKFQKDGKFRFEDGWVRVINYEEYNNYTGDSNKACKDKEMAIIPANILSPHTLPTPSPHPPHTASNKKSVIINNNPVIINNKYKEIDIRLTELLYSLVLQNYSFLKDKWNKEKDYEEMGKLNRIDNYTYKQIEFVINWSQRDEFWKQNIRSVNKLREKFEELVVRIKSSVDKNKRKVINFDQPIS